MTTAADHSVEIAAAVLRERPAAPALAPGKSRRAALLLLLAMLAANLSNLRYVGSGDTNAVRFIPFGILLHHRLDADPWVRQYLRPYQDGTLPYGVYFAARSHGHWMSSYPIVTPLLVTPLYLPAAWWVAHRPAPPSDAAMDFYAEAMEKLSAALLAAVTVALFYLAMRKVVDARASLVLALVLGLASPTWSIGAQALLLHVFTELSLALLLWALLRDNGSRKSGFWIGLALALAVANKPSNLVIAAPVVVWFVWKHRARLAPFLVPLVTLGAAVLAYNLYYFGTPLGAYVQAFQAIGYGGVELRGNMLEGSAGLLVSPNRGLFIYVPWTLLSLWGAVRLWRSNTWPWVRFLIAGAAAHYLVYAKLDRWYGGYCFGPRYFTDIMPLLVFFLVPLWPDITSRRAVNGVLAATVAVAFTLQVVGVYYYPNGEWNTKPVSVDDMPQRVWDWRDLQIVRTIKAGPAHTKLGDHLRGVHKK